MARSTEVKVTSEGMLIPRSLLPAWGDVKEVEIERRGDSIIIKPKAGSRKIRDRIVREMRDAGLVETLPWVQPPPVSPEERARLAEELSRGKPLSEVIIDEREERA